MIQINVNVGDTIYTGKFRNKPTIIKTIEYDEFGLPLINGKKVVNFKLREKKEMKESILRKIIREEIKTQLIRESSHAKKVYQEFIQLNADGVEEFFNKIYLYFVSAQDELDNMDARGIAKDLRNAHSKIKNRTGN